MVLVGRHRGLVLHQCSPCTATAAHLHPLCGRPLVLPPWMAAAASAAISLTELACFRRSPPPSSSPSWAPPGPGWVITGWDPDSSMLLLGTPQAGGLCSTISLVPDLLLLDLVRVAAVTVLAAAFSFSLNGSTLAPGENRSSTRNLSAAAVACGYPAC
jgi:hypothetical protein